MNNVQWTSLFHYYSYNFIMAANWFHFAPSPPVPIRCSLVLLWISSNLSWLNYTLICDCEMNMRCRNALKSTQCATKFYLICSMKALVPKCTCWSISSYLCWRLACAFLAKIFHFWMEFFKNQWEWQIIPTTKNQLYMFPWDVHR